MRDAANDAVFDLPVDVFGDQRDGGSIPPLGCSFSPQAKRSAALTRNEIVLEVDARLAVLKGAAHQRSI